MSREIEVAAARGGRLARLQRLLAHTQDAEARGQHQPFCEPVTARSRQSSMRESMQPIELTPSTKERRVARAVHRGAQGADIAP